MGQRTAVRRRRQHVLPVLAVLLAATVGVLVHVTFVAQDLEQEYVQAEANIATTARVRSRITRRSGSRQRADAEQRTDSGQTELVRGTVVSRLDGSPICGAVVRMGAERTTTNTGGRFEMRIQWTDGELEVAADRFRTVRVPAHELRSYPKGIPLQLGPGGAVGGRVLDEAGQAVAEAKVSVGGTRFPTEVVKTDADGRFVAKGVPIGDFMVRADPPADRLLLPAVAESIPTGSVDVVLVCRRGSALRGTVLSPDGTPVADARGSATSTARSPTESYSARTGARQAVSATTGTRPAPRTTGGT